MKDQENISANKNTDEFNWLSDLKRPDNFKTPSGYFDKLPVEIAEKISAGKGGSHDVRFAFPRLALAAAIAIALITTGIMYYISSQKIEPAQVVLTYDELMKSGMAYEYDDQLLFEYYFSNKTTENGENDSYQMDEYLIEDNIDISLIINEL